MSRKPTADRPRRPGRPRQFDPQPALDDLLTLFWRKGYEPATQEEMLAATGLSSSTLYRSFGNKSDILATVLRRYRELVTDTFFAPLERGHSGTRDVRAFLDVLDAHLRGPMGAAGCLMIETMQDPINQDPRIKSLTDRHLTRMRNGLRAALRRGADAGELSPSAAVPLADAIQAAVLGVLARARADTPHAVALLKAVRALVPDPE